MPFSCVNCGAPFCCCLAPTWENQVDSQTITDYMESTVVRFRESSEPASLGGIVWMDGNEPGGWALSMSGNEWDADGRRMRVDIFEPGVWASGKTMVQTQCMQISYYLYFDEALEYAFIYPTLCSLGRCSACRECQIQCFRACLCTWCASIGSTPPYSKVPCCAPCMRYTAKKTDDPDIWQRESFVCGFGPALYRFTWVVRKAEDGSFFRTPHYEKMVEKLQRDSKKATKTLHVDEYRPSLCCCAGERAVPAKVAVCGGPSAAVSMER